MSNSSLLNTPVLWINQYLQEKTALDVGIGMPIFPSMPASIDDLTESWITVDPGLLDERQSNLYGFAGVMGTWDRMFRLRRGPFPHIRTEQILYYFYATQSDVTETMVQVQEEVLRLLDRGDESAEEINKWFAGRSIPIETRDRNGSLVELELENMFYFHNFKVYQLEEVRDIIDFGTARTYGGNKIIIEYTYHQMPELINLGTPRA